MMLVLWEGPEEAPGGPGMGGHGTAAGALAAASGAWAEAKAEVMDLKEARPRRQAAPHYQAGLPGQRHENQVPGGDLALLSAIKESEIAHFFLGASLN